MASSSKIISPHHGDAMTWRDNILEIGAELTPPHLVKMLQALADKIHHN
jgi:hypothetical protein